MNIENKKTILLVEDEAIIAIVVSKALERFGYNVMAVSSGEKAVEFSETDEKIDLILMDINLGDGIDGTEAARRILQFRNIPIVFHTSHSERDMVEKVRGITRYGYVVKSSGDFVLQSSMEMAFALFNSHEEARKESIRSRTILRTIPDMMFIVDRNGFFRDYSNGEDSDSLLIPPEKIIGSNIGVLFLPDEQERLLELFRECLDSGNVQNYSYTLDIEGVQKIYDLRVAKLDDEEVLAIVRDITERKRSEIEIKTKTEELEATNEELNAAMEEMEAANEELMVVNEDLLVKDEAILREKIFTEAILESIPGYLYVYDEQRNLLRWNKNHEIMTGYSAEELSHMNMSDWFEGDDAVRVAAAVEDIFKNGYGEVEANLLIRGGGKLLIRTNGVLFTVDGKKYFTGVGIDISKDKKNENELRRSEKLYKKAQEMGHVGNWEYNIQTTTFWGSDEAKRLYGFDPEQEGFTTEEVEKCIPEREMVHQALIDLIEKDKEYNLEFDINPKDGSKPRIIWSVAELQRDEKGNPLIVTGVIHDITDRKKAEDQLRKSENKLETMLQTMVDGMVTVDPAGQIIYFNQSAVNILGIGKDILGKFYDSREWKQIDEYGNLYPADKLPLAIVLKEKRVVHDVQHQIVAKDGESKWLSVNAAPLFDSSGELFGGIASFRDITKLKESEDKVKSLLKEKDVLLGETHHRVKNNMMAIQGILSMQSEVVKDDECKNILKNSVLRIKNMMALYDKLYRQDNFGERSIKEFLEPMILEIIEIFNLTAPVKTEIDIEDFILNSNILFPIGIIINELITNSIKYAFKNSVSGLIRISSKKTDNRVEIIYCDNGKGLPAKVNFGDSTGFGMQLVAMLTEQIGGSIRIERGEGAKFVLEFEV